MNNVIKPIRPSVPYDEQVERCVLYKLLKYPTVFDQVHEKLLRKEYFFVEQHREIYDVMIDIRQVQQLEITFLSVRETILRLKPHLDVTLAMAVFIDTEDDGQSLEFMAALLRDYHLKRSMIGYCYQLTRDCQANVDPAHRLLNASMEYFIGLNGNVFDQTIFLKDVLKQLYQQCEDNRHPERRTPIVTCGIDFIDQHGGIVLPGFTVLGAATSQGKSAFAEYIVLQLLRQHIRTAYFTLEMTPLRLVQRLVSIETGINGIDLRLNPLNDKQFEVMRQRVVQMGTEWGKDLCFDSTRTSSFEGICAAIRRMAAPYRKDRVEFFVVDYMQILEGNGMASDLRDKNVQQFMANMSRTLYNLASDYKVGIMALSQLNREHDDPEPTLNRLRDSNQIGDACDDVWLLYRPEAYGKNYSTDPTVDPHGTALIKVVKRRDGPTGHFWMGFEGECTRFYPFASAYEIPRCGTRSTSMFT